MSLSSSASQPSRWKDPSSNTGNQPLQTGLKLWNSLSDSLVPFVPEDPYCVKYYLCGPTVYDSSHMGHARTYVGFDVVRRVMENYFGYGMFCIMNITDIDDKIILRARRNYVLDKYLAESPATQVVLDDVLSGLAAKHSKLESNVAQLKSDLSAALATAEQNKSSSTAAKRVKELQELVDNESFKFSQVKDSQKAVSDADTVFKQGGMDEASFRSTVLREGRDILSELIDAKVGADVRDTSIFRAHGAKFEAEFHEDMQSLNVLPAHNITRVTEFVPEIEEFIARIADNGFAYESDGSVYFDTQKFSESHFYAKCSPSSVGNTALAAEGEGALASGSGKKHPNDFALWKASKPGEPEWESRWGMGRPGWHIECSVMASQAAGPTLDIHGGGCDLMFPHHDNEMAQSEAYWGHQQWVHYFLHTGHLYIEGRKMSKSLKNFFTIREVLEKFTARQIRILFLTHGWRDPLNYAADAMEAVLSKEQLFKNFFMSAKTLLRGNLESITTQRQRWTELDKQLHDSIVNCQKQVHESLCCSIDTVGAMKALSELIKEYNKYISAAESNTKLILVQRTASYIKRIVQIFGIDDGKPWPFIAGLEGDSEAKLAPILDAVCSFREEVRAAALSKDGSVDLSEILKAMQEKLPVLVENAGTSCAASPQSVADSLSEFMARVEGIGASSPKDLLAACDELRDNAMCSLGVRLEDQANGPAIWKLDDPAVLLAEKQAKELAKAEAAKVKIRNKLNRLNTDLEKWKSAKDSPRTKFEAKGYTQFDDKGVPTSNPDGSELEKSRKKAIDKEFKKYSGDHEKYLKKAESDPEFLQKLEAEVSALQGQL